MDGGETDEMMAERASGAIEDVDPPAASPRRRRLARILSVVVGVALVAGGVGYASTTAAWPGRQKWDPAVETLARFVEKTRGGRFDNPVEVVFNSRVDYSAHFAIDREKMDSETTDGVATQLGTLRALGFVAGDVDLVDTAETLGHTGTVGFFDPKDKRIHVRGERTAFDTAMKVTLVHELTHAYDFSHFDLDVDEETFTNSGEEFAYRAVVEGSAELVEWEFIASLPEAEQAALTKSEKTAQGSEDAAALDALPAVFLESMALPYALGPRFLQAVGSGMAGDPQQGVNRALREWPKSEEQIASFDQYVEGKPPRPMKPPALSVGEEEAQKPDDFGQLSLALLVAPHVGAERAWAAVQGWAGDAMSTYRVGKGGVTCVRINVAFDGANFVGEFLGAARDWAQSVPGATVTTDNDTVMLQSCDPGPNGPAVRSLEGVSVTAVVVARSDLVSNLEAQGVGADEAACATDAIFDRIRVEAFVALDARLVDDPQDSDALGQVQDLFDAAAEVCAQGP